VLDQAEQLALLSQRFTGHPPRTAAATSGSAPAPAPPPPPRPPNPLRTGPVKASDEPPGPTASLLDHERYFPYRGRHV